MKTQRKENATKPTHYIRKNAFDGHSQWKNQWDWRGNNQWG